MRSMLALIAFALAPAAVAQTTWYVDLNGTPPGSGTVADPYTSIHYAVSQPSTISGDSILVAPGTYREQVVILAKGVHVKSIGGPAVTSVDAGGNGSAVQILATGAALATLEGLTLTHGSGSGSLGPQGGGLFAAESLLSLVDCVIEANDARTGGGMFLRNCQAELEQCVIRANTTFAPGIGGPEGGGLYVERGAVWLNESVVEDNTAGTPSEPGYGGGIFSANGFVHAQRTVFRGNWADKGGGGLFANSGRIENCLIAVNQGQFGGGILGGSGLFVKDSQLIENAATSLTGSNDFGGGVYGPVTLVGSRLYRNRATGRAGAAHGATLKDCSIVDNWATAGSPTGLFLIAGGVYDCTLSNCIVRGNWSMGNGAEFLAFGGGAAESTLIGCTVFQNSALGPRASGGGLADCDVSYSTIHDNHSDGFGGGIHAGTIRHCTIVGNSADIGADGIVRLAQGTTVVQNSIVWNNGEELWAAPNAILAVTYSDVKGGFAGSGNIDLDPQFWNEAAFDFHLLATSPCIDAGDPTSPPDPDGSVTDMGAFPYDPSYTGG